MADPYNTQPSPSSGSDQQASWGGPTTYNRNRQQINDQQRDELYGTLVNRSQLSEQVTPDDPLIKSQTDAFRNEQERSRRGYMSDLAEKQGPLANLSGERRMAHERAGQAVGSLQNQLMVQELNSRRGIISEALQSRASLLTSEQQAGLQRELAQLDAQIKQEQMALQRELGLGNQNLDLERILMGQRQFDAQLAQQQEQQNRSSDQWAAEFGLTAADRANYWDAQRGF